MDLSAAQWHKSTRSTGNGGECVEVADNLPGAVYVRDTKDHGTGPVLTFSREAWRDFVIAIKIP